jgi:hypothetical protein
MVALERTTAREEPRAPARGVAARGGLQAGRVAFGCCKRLVRQLRSQRDVQSVTLRTVHHVVGRDLGAAPVTLASFTHEVLLGALGFKEPSARVLADKAKDVRRSSRPDRIGNSNSCLWGKRARYASCRTTA